MTADHGSEGSKQPATPRRGRLRRRIAGVGVAFACFGAAFAMGSAARDEPVPPAEPVPAAPAAASPRVTSLGVMDTIPRLRREQASEPAQEQGSVTTTEPSETTPTPVDPTPVDPIPVDPTPVDPTPGSPSSPTPGGPSSPGPGDSGQPSESNPTPGGGGGGDGVGSTFGTE
jgi:hypothetical protein